MVLYEYLVTVHLEVKSFWKGRFTGAAILFYLNRYTTLLGNMYNLTVFIPMSDSVG